MFGKKKEDKIKDEDMYSVSKNVEDIFISNTDSDSESGDELVGKSEDNELVNKSEDKSLKAKVDETDGLKAKKKKDSDGLKVKETKVLDTDGLKVKEATDGETIIADGLETNGEPLMVKVSGEVKDADGIDLKSLSKNQLREYRRTGKIN